MQTKPAGRRRSAVRFLSLSPSAAKVRDFVQLVPDGSNRFCLTAAALLKLDTDPS